MTRCICLSLVLASLLLPAGLGCQLVCGPRQNCSCGKEKVSPNLTVSNPVRLTGALYDPTGAPIQFEKTIIQVRNAKNEEVLFSTELDNKGRFDLGIVPAGRFRLIPIWKKDKEVARLPGFDQPKPSSCSGEKECDLRTVLSLHGTDQLFEFCPPK